MPVRVLINGYGTIGKRIADAVAKQPDMTLVGVVKRSVDFRAYTATKKLIPIYTPTEELAEKFEAVGIKVKGTIRDGLARADIVIDAAPGGYGSENKKLYEEVGIPAIFQGGEKASVADVSFVAQANYESALGRKYIRVVSCNTTGMSRVLSALGSYRAIRRVRATLVRRAADPWETKKGPINAIVPKFKMPSHHAEDVKTVLGDLDIFTVAVVVPTTIMHLHILEVEFEDSVDKASIVDTLNDAPRILVAPEYLNIDSTATAIELARDLGRDRGDLYEVLVFEKGIAVQDNVARIVYGVHQEAIVVPENIDAVRAALKVTEDPMSSIELTDTTLGILRRL